ncbi:MAG: hypothetical protein RLO01_05180 [Thalassobaculaceae bacterium]
MPNNLTSAAGRPRIGERTAVQNLALGIGGLCATAILSIAASGNAQAQTAFPGNSLQSCQIGSAFNTDWTELSPLSGQGGPKLGPAYDKKTGLVYIFPPNGPSFESTAGDSPCKFFSWGAQMFYWATSTITNEIGSPPPATFPPNSLTPYVFDTEFYYKVSNAEGSGGTNDENRQFIGQGDNGPEGVLAIRTLKSTEAGQAGDQDVLISQADSLVYYGIHTNRLYGYFRTQQANNSENPSEQFPTTSAEVCSVLKYSRDSGLSAKTQVSTLIFDKLCPATATSGDREDQLTASTLPPLRGDIIPQIETAVDYLAMTVEMKTSWVDASTVADTSKYITQTHSVPIYNKLTADIWEPAGTETKELALVGMHIVAGVEGHPEMIWATIEHRNNAPNVTYPYLNGNNHLAFGSDNAASNDWLFWNPNGPQTTLETLKPSARVHDNGNIVSETGVNISPVNVKRFHPWGGPVFPSASDAITPEMLATAKTNSDLISLNQDIINQINGFYVANGVEVMDPRLNYFISGATWTSDGSIPVFNATTPSKVTGSTILANTTMETFHQEDNCFACHSANAADEGLTISHIFSNLKPLPIKIVE